MAREARCGLAERDGQPEKSWVGRSFSKAAEGYDAVAGLQRQVGDRLVTRLRELSIVPHSLLDLGAGTGYCTARLAEQFPHADLLALDIALGMLRMLDRRNGLRGRIRRVCGDGEFLPLRGGCMDVIFSNLALQWCADLPGALAEFKRILRPGGAVLFSTFGEATLRELRDAWARVDDYSHVNAFVSRKNMVHALEDAGFRDFAVISERRVLSYPGVEALLRELKGLGAHNVTANRPRHLTGKGSYRRMLDAYAPQGAEGRVEASFEVLYAQARLPAVAG